MIIRAPFKIGLVAGGYFGALFVAFAVVTISSAFTDSPDSQGGMAAFGDMLLFITVFGTGAILPTLAGLYFLRPYPKFWMVFSAAALAAAAIEVLAVLLFFAGRLQDAPPTLQFLAFIGLIKLFTAPCLALLFFGAALIAPIRRYRIWLFVSCSVEGAVFAVSSIVGIMGLFGETTP